MWFVQFFHKLSGWSWKLNNIERCKGNVALVFQTADSWTFHISCISLGSHSDNVSLQRHGHLSLWSRVSLLADETILLAIPRLCPDLCRWSWYQKACSGYGFWERIYLKVPYGAVDHHRAMFLWVGFHLVFIVLMDETGIIISAFRFKQFHCSKIVMQRHIQ